MLRWAGAVGLAGAFGPGWTSSQALACSAEPGAVLTITCPAGDPAAGPFQSSYSSIGDPEFTPVFIPAYDGNGTDHLIINGGAIAVGGGPVFIGGSEDALDASVGDVSLLGGSDIVDLTSGTVGTTDDPLDLNLGDGDNTFNASGGTVYGSIIAGDGIDTFNIGGVTTITTAVFTNGGADIVTIGGTAVITGLAGGDAIGLGGGDDRLTMTGGQLGGGLSGGDGDDTLGVQGGSIAGYVNGGPGDDGISITGGATVAGDLLGDLGNDTITIDGGNVAGFVSSDNGDDTVIVRNGAVGATVVPSGIVLGAGADTLTMSGGIVYGPVLGQGGGNSYTLSGGSIVGSLFAGSQDDAVTISGTTNISAASDTDAVGLEDGEDAFTMLGGTLQGSVSGNGGGDAIYVGGGSIEGDLNGNDGNDAIDVTAGSIAGDVSGGEGTDTLVVSGGTIAGDVSGDGDDDVMNVDNGSVGGDLSGGDGNDVIGVTGGSITGNVAGGDGDDTVDISGGTIMGDVASETVGISGGTINGGIDGQHVELHGGAVVGNISGIGPETLVIDNVGTVDPLSLSDGVIFSGTNANAQISDVDLAAGGTRTQNFVGFDDVVLDNSTLAFTPGSAQQIDLLTLGDGSTLYAPGNVNLSGAINATNSTINMVNGIAGDVFTLGGVTMNDATLGLDLDQQSGQADQLVAAAFAATGNNIINVNLIGAPAFAGETDIPVIVSAGAPVAGAFAITGIPGTPGALFNYSVLQAPGGGLIIRATPNNFGIAAAPDSAVNASIVDVAVEALYGINRDALDADLMLANGSQRIALTPSFGVFASGQFAHTEHGGYDISSGIFGGPGPSFDANDFSAAISLDFNAAKHFNFDKQYGLNLGIFAGYASTDVGLDPFQGFADMGGGNNRSGMFGAYALFRKELNYALVSAAAFLGNTDTSNGVLNTTGSYDTRGYAFTGSIGHIFLLSERTRLDLRGGLLGVTFKGDSYTDSGGNEFGESRISFGAVQFAPGVYGDFRLGDGMVFSPYARLELQQRFSTKNTAEIDTRTVNFEDADFSAALSSGLNLKMSERATLSGEVRGKWSSDSSTVGAKLGLKVAF